MISCKECQKLFESDKAFHGHLRAHKLKKAQYYQKHYPKYCLQTGQKLGFKNSDDLSSYLKRDFINEQAMYFYFSDVNENREKKEEMLIDYLIRLKEKCEFTPNQFELESSVGIPDITIFSKYFNYNNKCKELGFKYRFNYNFNYCNNLPIKKVPVENFCIIKDTRERDGFNFFNMIDGKLEVGDYTLGGVAHNFNYIERKSVGDAGSTFSQITKDINSPSRFERELDKAKESGKYIIILIESTILEFKKYRFYGFAQSDFILNRLRYISRQYKDNVQIVFGGTRNQCQNLIPLFLLLGDEAKNLDLQMWTDINLENLPRIFSKEDFIRLYK